MTRLIVFDLDGTLADGAHRELHITTPGQPKDWDRYFALCGLDTPYEPMKQVYNALRYSAAIRNGQQLEVWTGRIDQYREVTEDWFFEHGMGLPEVMRMRETSDRTQDDELKRRWLHEARARGDEVILAFEDRKRVVDMWRAEGVTCLQVREGDF